MPGSTGMQIVCLAMPLWLLCAPPNSRAPTDHFLDAAAGSLTDRAASARAGTFEQPGEFRNEDRVAEFDVNTAESAQQPGGSELPATDVRGPDSTDTDAAGAESASDAAAATAASLPVHSEQVRAARLAAYLNAWQDWLEVQCSLQPQCSLTDTQRLEVKQLCHEALAESQETWAGRRQEGRPKGLPDYAPFELTRSPGPIEPTNRTTFQARLRRLLRPEQVEVLAEQLAARSLRLLDADRARVIAVVDEQLHLTGDQRGRLENELRALLRNSSTSLFAFDSTGSPLEYLSPQVVAWRISELELTAAQRLMMESYAPELQRRQPQVVRMVLDLRNWEAELGELASQYNESLKNEMQKRVAEYVTLWKLTPAQHDHLNLAATGAVTRTVSEWRGLIIERLQGQSDDLKAMALQRQVLLEQARAAEQLRQLQGLEIQAASVSLSIPVNAEALDLVRVQNHPVWRRALAQVRHTNQPDGQPTAAWGFASCVDCTLTVLDRELWLHEDQLVPARQMVAAALPEGIERVEQPGRELLYLALVLKRTPQEELKALLHPAQQAAWEQLSGQFDTAGDSVQISLRDGSSFVLEYAW